MCDLQLLTALQKKIQGLDNSLDKAAIGQVFLENVTHTFFPFFFGIKIDGPLSDWNSVF
jgi:hypothetical protein